MRSFNVLPNVRFNRSKFKMPHRNLSSMNVGTLYPISLVEVLPGDTFDSKMTAVTRVSSTFIKPVMDNLFMDVYHFFVPLRLCYKDAEDVFGVSSPSAYVEDTFAKIPSLPACIIPKGSVGDYLGLPVEKELPSGISVLPFRAFARIYNEWFRNESLIDEVYVQDGALNGEMPNSEIWSPNNYMGQLPKVSKRKDYFTSALPKPQKGLPVTLPFGLTAPVETNGQPFSLGNYGANNGVSFNIRSGSGEPPLGSSYPNINLNYLTAPGGVYASYTGDGELSPNYLYYKDGLQVNLSGATSVNVNDLRLAFATQRMLEIDNLYGSRYIEYLNGHFGVTSPDSRLQIPEYLGGGRIPISITQVAQTSVGTEESPLANVGAFSLSVGHSTFNKGFVEHGYIITVACIRQTHSYQYGISKLWSRTERNQFYDPLFAHLGEQPIYQSEIFADSSVQTELRDTNAIFGYNEAWVEYRTLPNTITGQMRAQSGTDLDIWHFGDRFANAPRLNDDFIQENANNVNRTLTVESSNLDNFICDFYFDTNAIRVMPTYSTPSMVAHR